MIAALQVILSGQVIGTVDRNRRNILRFTYEDDATRAGCTPLSLSMPLALRTHTGATVERFLRALVPESNDALAAIERQHPGVDRHDPLSVLAAIGRDCPGAVQFCHPDDRAATIARTGTLERLSDSQIEQRLAELRTDEGASWTMPGEHWSLGGTQPKFALRRIGEAWYEAQGSQPTSHIVKPGIRSLNGQALVEHISMRAAAACGIDVAHTEYLEVKSESAIAITRFDRRTDGSDLVRLHQEDLCQALGVSEKYEEYEGPSASDIIGLLRDQSMTAADARANVERFVDGLIYNTVIAAPDAHARNYAVLLEGDRVRLAPVFDVSTNLPYNPSERGRVLSMSVGGEWVPGRVRREQWKRFADENDLDVDRIVKSAQDIAAVAPGAMLAALDEIADWDGSVAELRARLTPALDKHMTTVTAALDG